MSGYDTSLFRVPGVPGLPAGNRPSNENDDTDVYTYMPAAEDLTDRYGVSESEIELAERTREKRGYIGYVFRRGGNRKPERYDLIRILGQGAFGRAYTATTGGRDREERYVIKEIRSRAQSASDGEEYDISYVERELRMSKIIEERLGSNFCQTRAICAERRFFGPNRQVGYIVFPFYNAHALNEYLGMILYQRMKAFLRLKKKSGLPDKPLLQIIQMVVRGDFQTSQFQRQDRLDDLRKELRSIQTLALGLSVTALSTLALLHSKQIYHRDYKPENMLVGNNVTTAKLELRVIDFGLSCAASLEQRAVDQTADTDLQFQERYEPFVVCPNSYFTTPAYRDPLAWYITATDNDSRIEQSTKFDTYAAAKTILRIFSPDSYNASGASLKFPVVEASEFMPERLLQLLVDMSGEYLYEPSEVRRQILTQEQLSQRKKSFARRPSSSSALRQLLALVRLWDESEN